MEMRILIYLIYQGKYIDNGVEIMGQVTQKNQGYRTISNDTIVYNYNEFIKNCLKFDKYEN